MGALAQPNREQWIEFPVSYFVPCLTMSLNYAWVTGANELAKISYAFRIYISFEFWELAGVKYY